MSAEKSLQVEGTALISFDVIILSLNIKNLQTPTFPRIAFAECFKRQKILNQAERRVEMDLKKLSLRLRHPKEVEKRGKGGKTVLKKITKSNDGKT